MALYQEPGHTTDMLTNLPINQISIEKFGWFFEGVMQADSRVHRCGVHFDLTQHKVGSIDFANPSGVRFFGEGVDKFQNVIGAV